VVMYHEHKNFKILAVFGDINLILHSVLEVEISTYYLELTGDICHVAGLWT
jgi:hypothetical protein